MHSLLHYQRVHPKSGFATLPPLIILHGLMGNLQNFGSFAKQEIICRDRNVYLLDLRNHGNSFHDSSMTLLSMKRDLLHFLQHHQLHQIDLFGFSLGGKVSALSALDPQIGNHIRKLVIGDIAPVQYSTKEWDIPHILKCVTEIPLSQCKTRNEVNEFLLQIAKQNGVTALEKESMRQFLLTNLNQREDTGEWYWKCNVASIYEHVYDLASFPLQEKSIFAKDTLFLKGANSNLIQTDKHSNTIKELFPKATMEVFEKSGHWVHFEEPQKFTSVMAQFLNR